MFFLVLLMIMAIVCVALALIFAFEAQHMASSVCSVIAFAVFAIVVFLVAPVELGHGYVSNEVGILTKRLNTGVAYQVIASTKNSGNYVLLVKKTGASDFYAIRAEAVPPEHFTLIDGKPVAVAPPAAATPDK